MAASSAGFGRRNSEGNGQRGVTVYLATHRGFAGEAMMTPGGRVGTEMARVS